MNIFLVDPDPRLCAQALDDLRLNKMILETAQMLCTAYRRLYPTKAAKDAVLLYKETHKNHPCTLWAGDNHENYLWTVHLFNELRAERVFRTGLSHMSWDKLWVVLSRPTMNGWKPRHNLDFSFDCSNMYDHVSVFDRYKLCLMNKWLHDKRPPSWTKRGAPAWANNANEIMVKTN